MRKGEGVDAIRCGGARTTRRWCIGEARASLPRAGRVRRPRNRRASRVVRGVRPPSALLDVRSGAQHLSAAEATRLHVKISASCVAREPSFCGVCTRRGRMPAGAASSASSAPGCASVASCARAGSAASGRGSGTHEGLRPTRRQARRKDLPDGPGPESRHANCVTAQGSLDRRLGTRGPVGRRGV